MATAARILGIAGVRPGGLVTAVAIGSAALMLGRVVDGRSLVVGRKPAEGNRRRRSRVKVRVVINVGGNYVTRFAGH